MSIYVGDIGIEIIVDCGTDISAATSVSLAVKKPDGSTAIWAGSLLTQNGLTHYIQYAIQAGDLSLPGIYSIQSVVDVSGNVFHGQTATFLVNALYT